MLRLQFPESEDSIEGWLSKYDKFPQILPDWPENERYAVVVVWEYGTPAGPETTGAVILSRDELVTISNFSYTFGQPQCRKLFFTVSRTLLLTPEVCDGLTNEAFLN